MRVNLFVAGAALGMLTMLAGCGDDDEHAQSPQVTEVSRGAISAVASDTITVNGIQFNTAGATVTVDDSTDSTALKKGMVVTVRGQLSDPIRGTAFEIKTANNLKGPVTSFNNLSSSMTVLGQKVRFDPMQTVFDNFSGGTTSSTSRVAQGQMVRVTGFQDPNGALHATFVQRKLPDWTATTTVTATGTITSMPTATTFTIGALSVNASGTTLPAGTTVGSFVKAVGTIPTTTSTALTATSVQLLQPGLQNEAAPPAQAQEEGFVSGLSGHTFRIGNTPADAGSLPLTGLANGSRALVQGTIGNGVLLVTRIMVEDPTYLQTNLVSNIPGLAATTDPNLVNAWGIARSATGPWWVNDNGTGFSTLYNGLGQPFPIATPLVVTIPTVAGGSTPANPTGIVFNNFSGFNVTAGVRTTSARFIFVTEDGTVAAWNSGSTATVKVNNLATGAVYKGAAMATNGTSNLLYVANFNAGTVNVFDSNYAPVTLPAVSGVAAFTVPAPHLGPPAGYAPFNIANIGGKLYVTYAQQDADAHDDVAGQGHGFVEVFNPDGSFVMSLQSGFWLNSPWGVALAPSDFGKFSNTVLVGNFGSGQIAAFDPMTGMFLGLLRDTHDDPIFISGLWGLGFGNGGTAGPTTTLFFAAGLNGESDGLFGTLTPITSFWIQ